MRIMMPQSEGFFQVGQAFSLSGLDWRRRIERPKRKIQVALDSKSDKLKLVPRGFSHWKLVSMSVEVFDIWSTISIV
jgi:hypothetical protein